MKDTREVLNQVEQKIAQSQNSLTTEAGPAEESHQQNRLPPSNDLIDAINQTFELFRINFHNQYFSAFGNIETLNQAKRLWLETLQRFPPEEILMGAKRAIEQCEYLPTLHKMIELCQGSAASHGLPDVHAAYIEACQAPSPKASFHWSHPAVYHAGRNSDWFMLANSSEKVAFPIFKENYLSLCQRVMEGEALPEPQLKQLPEHIEHPLSREENQKRLDELRQQLDL
ncbi:MAG: hypothetical protein AseanaTS_20950 [Candidatus Pelagadaptatus aseana]|uniref:replication protein P n=1 Tax=Candidatus Pelagadaptatus aseana TaxID=3120508 RepID=UPI0039B17FF9